LTGVIFGCCRIGARVALNVRRHILPDMVHKLVIIIPIAVVAGLLLWIVGAPVLGFQYTFWRMHRALDNMPESELIARTSDLPEVKAFLEKYEKARTYIDTDFHIAIIYAITECELTGQSCNGSQPYGAYLDVRTSLDTGYPDHSIFWCNGERLGSFPLGDKALIRHIQDC
jgi:hypothetical protein